MNQSVSTNDQTATQLSMPQKRSMLPIVIIVLLVVALAGLGYWTWLKSNDESNWRASFIATNNDLNKAIKNEATKDATIAQYTAAGYYIDTDGITIKRYSDSDQIQNAVTIYMDKHTAKPKKVVDGATTTNILDTPTLSANKLFAKTTLEEMASDSTTDTAPLSGVGPTYYLAKQHDAWVVLLSTKTDLTEAQRTQYSIPSDL